MKKKNIVFSLVVLSVFIISVLVGIATAGDIEDFITYTEEDPENKVTVTSNEVNYLNVNFRGTDTYVYKDKGINHFNGNFEHLITVQLSSIQTYAFPTVWMLTNRLVAN